MRWNGLSRKAGDRVRVGRRMISVPGVPSMTEPDEPTEATYSWSLYQLPLEDLRAPGYLVARGHDEPSAHAAWLLAIEALGETAGDAPDTPLSA